MPEPADISSDELAENSEDYQIFQGENGGTIQYRVTGDGTAVVASLSGDDKITQADLEAFKANNPDLVEALDNPNVTVPLVEERSAALEPKGRAG